MILDRPIAHDQVREQALDRALVQDFPGGETGFLDGKHGGVAIDDIPVPDHVPETGVRFLQHDLRPMIAVNDDRRVREVRACRDPVQNFTEPQMGAARLGDVGAVTQDPLFRGILDPVSP